MENSFGRHRQSIADIENQLHEIFNQHPNTHINDNNEPVIPGDDLVDVLQAFSEAYNGLQLMNDEETAKLKELIETNRGLEVTPSILIAFIAEKTKHSSPPPINPDFDENDAGDQSYMQLDELRPPSRARSSSYHDNNDDAGSSSDSNSSSFNRGWSNSQSDGPPRTPGSAIKSPFDHERRQRSTPLSAAPPSSWSKRPAPARRRKSMDAGSRSDSESFGPPSSFSLSASASGRSSRQSSRTRSRAPSNPTSPVPSAPWSPNSSMSFPRPPSAASISRPGSRAGSRAGSRSGYRYDDPRFDDDEDHTIDASKAPFRNYDYNEDADDSFDGGNSISARGRMGRRKGRKTIMNTDDLSHDGGHESPLSGDEEEDHDSDEDQDDSYILHQREMTTSDASMQSIDRVEALTRMNADLGRKLMEAERTLQHKLSEHELELEEMQSKLEEMRTELSATKREEKELRSKERQNNTQIAALEAEIAKVTKALESARSTYASLQRQYQEQCTVSERYRDELRQREELIRNLRDASALHDLEAAKWHKEQEVFESRISALEESLSIADAAHGQLEEQKQENLLLKETIDRMRFDMDELRNNAANNIATTGGTASAKGSMSKSLGAELAEKMKLESAKEEEGDEEDEVESQLGNLSMESTTVVDEEAEDTEGEEDVIQTIITRKKKKVASRANQSQILTQTFEETKEYSDSSTQYDLTFFFKSHSSQTDPEPKILTASLSTQTDPPPETGVIAIQTEPEPVPAPPTMFEMEIQTEPIEEEDQEETRGDSRSPSPQEQPESMASSSSTIIPPTPKAHPHLLEQPDAPPSYHQVSAQEQEERELRALAESLKKWHRGVNLKVPLEGVPGGIPEEAIEEWKTLQSQLGVGCAVIDKIVENSQRVPRKHPKDTNAKGSWFPFINIHNKIYFGAAGASSTIAMWVGASALVLLAISPYMAPAQYSVPGGPTYYDRSAWSSFNSLHGSGEGFSADGTAAVWSFLGRVGGGAARIARGWPT